MSWATWLWLAIGVQAAALEAYALATDHRDTLSQTLQRAFGHAPAVSLVVWGGLVAIFTVHIWGRFVARKKAK